MKAHESKHPKDIRCDCELCREAHCLAEYLLDLARAITRVKGLVEVSGVKWGADNHYDLEVQLARASLALRLDAMPNEFKLRAVFEQWDHRRLMLEMFV